MIDLSYALNKKTLKDFNFVKKTVLLRMDFNVPLEGGKILDDTRIQEGLPTIKYLLEQNAKIILISHLKRPKGWDSAFSLTPIVDHLKNLLNCPISFFQENLYSPHLKEAIEAMSFPGLMVLENIRFYVEETANDEKFSQYLASLGQIYINDAFGTMHRSHASTEGIAHFLPSGMGFLVEKELVYVKALSENAQNPVTIIMAGGKVFTKINLLKGLLKISDFILIGGGMVFTFLKAMGYSIGNSIFEKETLSFASEILDLAKFSSCKLIFPVDIVCAKELKPQAETIMVSLDKGVPNGYMGLDIGDQTIQLFSDIISQSETIFWNGPVGVFEVPPFDKGTQSIAMAIGKRSVNKSVMSIIGGGESGMAAKLYGINNKVNHVSSGGGALLEMLEGVKLPGLTALSSVD